jgi:predicted RNA-binding Zn ribbon-like protein
VTELLSTRPDPFLVADHVALDVLNSRCSPWGEEIDWWDSGSGLIGWMRAANLIDSEWSERISIEQSIAQLDLMAERARALRETFRDLVVERVTEQRPASAASLRVLNRHLSKGARYPQLVLSDEGLLELEWRANRRGPDQLLSLLAQPMAELLASPKFANVKNCEWPPCTLWFLDVSKNGKRRWCTMSVCGNRAKAAAHRARKKQKTTGKE